MVKLPLLLFFGAVVVFGATEFCTPSRFKVSPAALYQSDNELYFNNELPKNIEVVAQEPPDGDPNKIIMGETEHTIGTHYYKIYISPKYNRTQQDERGSVLHEACHIRTWEDAENNGLPYGGGHSESWQNCMKSLALQNAFSTIW